MAPFGRLTGGHRLKPGKELSAALDRIKTALAVDPACAWVERRSDAVVFEMDPARWRTWQVALGLHPRGGRIIGGRVAAEPDRPRDLVAYDLRLEARRPLLVAMCWAAILLALAVTGVISTVIAAILVGLSALRFIVRQGEREWIHRLIGDASGAATSGAAERPLRPVASTAS